MACTSFLFIAIRGTMKSCQARHGFFIHPGAKMIDPQSEDIVFLTDVPKSLPNRPNVTTVWRWHLRGVRGVKLETLLMGGRRATSHEALGRFFIKVTAAADGEPV